MASEHSYGATKLNNVTENSAVDFLLKVDSRFIQPTKEERKELLIRFGLPNKYARSFDILFLSTTSDANILNIPLEEITLVELKTTQKRLVDNPKGFFFGATENEFNLAEKLGDQYKFCFISLHPESKSYALLTLDEVNQKIRTKRVQYQINF